MANIHNKIDFRDMFYVNPISISGIYCDLALFWNVNDLITIKKY